MLKEGLTDEHKVNAINYLGETSICSLKRGGRF